LKTGSFKRESTPSSPTNQPMIRGDKTMRNKEVQIKTRKEMGLGEGEYPNGWNTNGHMDHLFGKQVTPFKYEGGLYYLSDGWVIRKSETYECTPSND
jgi:hypothetical protein